MGLNTARCCGAIAMVSCALLAAGAARASADLPPGTWSFDGRVSKLVRDPATGAVFAGGTFTREQAPVGGLFATDAGGDGTPQPLPAVDGAVTAVAADGHGGWYVAWTRSTAFARTSGMLHATAGGAADPGFAPAPDGPVSSLVVSGSTVYAAGPFTHIGGAPRGGLAALDAGSGRATPWDPGAPDGPILSLAVAGPTVYAGGDFAQWAGQPRHDLAAVDAATGALTDFDPDVEGGFGVDDLEVSGATVYAGGNFATIGGQARRNLGAVDATTGAPTAWDPEPDDFVLDLAVADGTVYAGGWFRHIGGAARNGVAALDSTGAATAWDARLDSAFIGAVAVSGSVVYVGGGFSSAGRRVLAPSGKAARIGRLRARGAYALRFTTPVAGRLTVRWLHGHTLVASVRATFTRPATRTVHIRLTRAGRRLLRHAKRLRLTGRATFAGVSVRRTFTLRR